MSNDKIKLEVKIDPHKCTAEINLYDVFANLSDEERDKIVKGLAWETPIASVLTQDAFKEYSTETYFPQVHKLRTDVLTSPEAPEMIRKWAETMVRIVNQEKAKTKESSVRFWKSYNKFRNKFASFDTSNVFDFDTRIETEPTDEKVVEDLVEIVHSAVPVSTAGNIKRVVIKQDESGHWYVIPADMLDKFAELLETNGNEFENIFGEYRTGGINNVELFAQVD